jgi:GT2 family glycosyltransferase
VLTPEEKTGTLEAEIARLAAAQAALEHQVAMMRDLLLRQADAPNQRRLDLERRIGKVEHSINHVNALVDLILESRIWKTLQSGGGVLLRLSRLTARGRRSEIGAARQAQRLSPEERKQDVHIRCDTLAMEPKDPVCGIVEIRGWALAAAGIDRVEVSIDGKSSFQAQYGSSRPDIGHLFPEIPSAGNSGYLATFDTRRVADGIHRVSVTGYAKNGKKCEIDIPLLVNQRAGVNSEYSRWLEIFDRSQPELVRLKISGFTYSPMVSVLVPVYKTKPAILRETIESVRRQTYAKWELCLVDDGSGDPELSALLVGSAAADARIRVAAQDKQSGISAASNRALAMATGEYVALLDHDDALAEDALFHVVDALQNGPRPDLLYSDEDHMDEAGRRFAPFFKPDWSPDLILAENYVCHLMVFRRELGLSVGGFRTEFDVSQDHDLLLRLSLAAQKIVHIPRILYHWRTSLASMSRASSAEDRVLSSSRSAIEGFLAEAGIEARVEDGLHVGRWRVRYPIPAGTRVSILIPSAGKTDILERNLQALWSKAGQTPYEAVIIDNCKGENNTTLERYVERLAAEGRPIRRFDQRNEPFNYSFLNNRAAKTCESPLLLFLNDDTEGISPGWLDALVELAVRKEVGAVGAKLLYPDGTIQHGGVTMGLAEICGHSFKGARGNERHYYDFPDLIRNVSAVTAACVMIRAEVFQEVGGFDGAMFPIAYNDIDLCLRIGAAGYRILYTPHALLYHYEAFSKSDKELHPHPAETLALKTRWREVIEADPYYNPNLTRHKENWSLRWD